MFVFWTLQGVWVFVTLFPTLMLNGSQRDRPIGLQDYIGWTMWMMGMLFEVLADFQKSVFRMDPKNKVDLLTALLHEPTLHVSFSRANSSNLDFGRFLDTLTISGKSFSGSASTFPHPASSRGSNIWPYFRQFLYIY